MESVVREGRDMVVGRGREMAVGGGREGVLEEEERRLSEEEKRVQGRTDGDGRQRESLQRRKVMGKWESVCDFSLIPRLLNDKQKIFVMQ
ncbi:hypothetical protein C1H46_039021 [Malus baccata]|uniref:Uncharacterized protein n=1 Tax=Malus baccata TaxID=106549 RepID=A0A540KMK0_MALBA|nr:hypothetical protein C1H46_039021 [Malus baccata]